MEVKHKNQYFKRRRLSSCDLKLAERIKQLRKEKGFTQEEFAFKLELNPSYIAYIETGRRGLSLPVLFKIARVLKIKVRNLFTF